MSLDTSPSQGPIIALVVAMAENRVIGRAGQMPWRMPSDLKRFRRITLGCPVIMGRKTFQSIGRPLDGRQNIVLSRHASEPIAGVVHAASLAEALAVARAGTGGAERGSEIMVIGGAEIYALALPLATRIYLTVVHASPAGDTWFPELCSSWQDVLVEAHGGAGDDHPATFKILERTPAPTVKSRHT
jgi:dihydrofolate reductase